MSFDTATRLIRVPLPAQNKIAGGAQTLTWQLPKSGLLARIYLDIQATIGGTLGAVNTTQGVPAIVSNVRVNVNTFSDIINITGPGYHYMLRYFQNDYRDPVPAASTAAPSVASFDLSMMLETQINKSDPLGLIDLQTEESVCTLYVSFAADTAICATGTITATVTPYIEFFQVPQNPQDYPPLNIIFATLEDSQVVAGAGDFTYTWPRGETYVRVLHGASLLQSAADAWSAAKLRTNQSNYLENMVPALADKVYGGDHVQARRKGLIPFDFSGSSGLQSFGKSRDFIDSSKLTDIATVITMTGAITLQTIRQQLVVLR